MVEAALARLLYGEVHGGIWGRRRLQPTEAQAAAEIDRLVRHLQRHQERLDSRCAGKGGSPRGNGGSESADTCICPVRFTRAGAWWSVTNASQRLALRGAQDHRTFARVVERYRQRRQEESGQKPPKK
jgi:hypothetical protein